MALEVEERGSDDAYAQDGSVDLRGNPILRSKRGGWKACWFLVVYEIFERMAYFGIATNLFIYLTRKLHQGTVTSANNVTYWVGTIWLTPILGAYLSDTFLRRYWTFLIASAIYLLGVNNWSAVYVCTAYLGMCLLTIAVSIDSLKPPPCADPTGVHCKKANTLQLAVFFGSLYILALGTGGTKPNIVAFGADQFDEFVPNEKLQKLSFFNWWMFSAFCGILFANTLLVWIQDNVGWTLGYAIPTLGLVVSILVVLAGSPFYRHKLPGGSPLTRMAQVIIAAIRKWKVPIPADHKDLHELDLQEYAQNRKVRIDPTTSLRILNKACIETSSTGPSSLCTVTQVEETKQMLRMIPIFVCTITPGIMFAQTNTLFVEQGTTLNRRIGHFHIPPASLQAFVTLPMLITMALYDRCFVKIIRRYTKNPRGITLLQRIGIGMSLHVVIMTVASLTERYRLSVAREHGLVHNAGQVPRSIFILLPQFVLMGISNAFLQPAQIEFFYDQAPENTKSLGTSCDMTSLGIASFLSSFLLTAVSHITKRNGDEWIKNNLNDSHLNYFYGLLAVMSALNVLLFLAMSKFYVYKAEISDSMDVLSKGFGRPNPRIAADQETTTASQ